MRICALCEKQIKDGEVVRDITVVGRSDIFTAHLQCANLLLHLESVEESEQIPGGNRR